ncbi:bifunctional pyr operon transcriptional regulator/uracil phosphoribosyltransferase PyrR [bacterium]|nr:bifunctional pyr operon transcriptional regulator/uracil phosphoribosyltransferase PyrR [bacterium]
MKRVILDYKRVDYTLIRLCHQLVENHDDFKNSAIIALQPRGILLGRVLCDKLKEHFGLNPLYGELDATFYRDDFRRTDKPLLPNAMKMDFGVEDKRLILVDDVLYTGRTIRAALDSINDFGRPSHIELLTLINRKYKREVPIHPDYVGEEVDTRGDDYVNVEWKENLCKVWIRTDKN